MIEIIFNSILPVEKNSINNSLVIGGNILEINGLLELFDSEIDLIEPNNPMIEYILENVKSTKINTFPLKFEDFTTDKTYELCLCLLVLHFINEPTQFIEKIYQTLEKDGILILSQFSNFHLDWWEKFSLNKGADVTQVNNTANGQNIYIKSITNDQTTNIFRNVGFKRVEKICQIINIDMWLLQK